MFTFAVLFPDDDFSNHNLYNTIIFYSFPHVFVLINNLYIYNIYIIYNNKIIFNIFFVFNFIVSLTLWFNYDMFFFFLFGKQKFRTRKLVPIKYSTAEFSLHFGSRVVGALKEIILWNSVYYLS